MAINCGSEPARDEGNTVYLKDSGERVNIAAFARMTR
jgi:hypothetical protein